MLGSEVIKKIEESIKKYGDREVAFWNNGTPLDLEWIENSCYCENWYECELNCECEQNDFCKNEKVIGFNLSE